MGAEILPVEGFPRRELVPVRPTLRAVKAARAKGTPVDRMNEFLVVISERMAWMAWWFGAPIDPRARRGTATRRAR